MADRREKIILGLDVGPYVRGLATASTATKAFVKELDSSDSRMGNLVQTSLALGPALVPIGAAAVPAVAALTNGLGAAAGAAGVAALAFSGIGDALGAVNDYQLEPSAENLEKVRQALEDLGPAGANFVLFLDKLEPKLDRLQNIARGGLFPGVEEGITSFLQRGPQVERIVANIANAMGDLVAEGGEALAGGRFDAFFDYVENEAAPILQDMGRTIGNVAEGLGNMLVGFGPASDDFSGILLDLSRDFAEWSRSLENNEGFQDFVDYVRRVTPSALETLGSLVGALADIVEAAAPIGELSLPIIRGLAETLGTIADSPVGPVLISAAAGISAMSRAAALFSAANGSALVGMFKTSAEEGGKLGAAGQKLAGVFSGGGALAAGVGATALAFTDLDEQMGLSNTTMFATMGLVAGPWGAAIGAGTGLLLDFVSANNDLEDSAKRVNEIMGGTDASGILDSLIAQQKGAAEASDNYDKLQRAVEFIPVAGGYLGDLVGSADDANASLGALTETVTAFLRLQRFDSVLNGDSLASFSKDADELEKSLVKAEPVLKRFGYTVEDVLSGNLSDSELRQVAAATRHYLRTVDSAPGRTKAMGAALKDLNDPMQTAADSADSLATALDSVFAPALNADAAMQARIESLIDLRKQLRKTNGEFDFSTQATRDSRAAIRDHVQAIADEAKAMAERGDGTRKVSRFIRAQRRDLIDLMVQSGATRKEARDLIDTQFRYGEVLRGLPNKKTTKVETPGLEKAIDLMGDFWGWTEKVPNKKETKTSAPGADKANRQYKELDWRMRTLKDKEVALTLNSNSKDVVSNITDMLANLFADGGIVEAYADGGMRENHIAQIARPGAMRIWAEPETGGEAYIPLAQSKRPRSRAIAEETVRRLGGSAQWNENGSITLDTRTNPNPNKPMRKIDEQYETIAREFGREMSDALNAGLAKLTFGFHWPLPRQFGPSGTWGHYSSGASHPALDWPAPLGTPIYSTLPGKVSSVQHLSTSYGNHVRINHGNGLESISAHMLQTKASVGDKVSPGETIGLVDSTGNSTGNHLHLEFRRNGAPINYTSWLHGGGPMGVTGPMGVYDGNHEGLDRAGPSAAKAYARSIMGRWGWGPFQWPYWEDLGNRESGWRWNATNPSSGAYGIPQSLPASKMASAGADWRTNVGTQLDWMAGYMSERYGGPYGAIQWHNAHNWYKDGGIRLFDGGGPWPSGTLGLNLSGHTEYVNDPQATAAAVRMANGGLLDDLDSGASGRLVEPIIVGGPVIEPISIGDKDALKLLKERAADAAKAIERENIERDKLRDKLQATRQRANDFSDTVAGNFRNDPFGGSLDEFYLQARADKNDARRANRLRRRAEKLGLDGPLAKQLLASGNVDLLAEIVAGGPSEVRKAERAFEQSRRASRRYGNASADMIFGHQLDKQTRALEKQIEVNEELRLKLERIEDRIGDRVEAGARKGTSDGVQGKNKLQSQTWREARD